MQDLTPVPAVVGGSLNNYDYVGQDPINSFDLNGTCYRGGYRGSIKNAQSGEGRSGALALGYNWDVVGPQHYICRHVDRIYSKCYIKWNRKTGDNNDWAIQNSCWNWVDHVMFKTHPHLWVAQPLGIAGQCSWTEKAVTYVGSVAAPGWFKIPFIVDAGICLVQDRR